MCLRWEARLFVLLPIGITVFFFNTELGYYCLLFGFAVILSADVIFNVSLMQVFLHPILEARNRDKKSDKTSFRNSPWRPKNKGSSGGDNKTPEALKAISRSRTLTLVGVTMCVVSSYLLYLNLVLFALNSLDIIDIPYMETGMFLNPFVWMVNLTSICNDFGLALVYSPSIRDIMFGPRVQNAVAPKSSMPESVELARSQLALISDTRSSFNVSFEEEQFRPPQEQPRGKSLKLIAQALEEELFSWSNGQWSGERTSTKSRRRTMSLAIAKVIDEEFGAVALHFFAHCVSQSTFIDFTLREKYHEVRRGHLAIYADVLEQVRQEPTFPELQRRSDKLVVDCEQLGRSQEQRVDTVSGLLAAADAVQSRFDTLIAAIASKTTAVFHHAPRKNLVRIFEKMAFTPGPDNGRPQKICDVVRGAVECDNFITVSSVLRLMCDLV